MTEGWRQSTLTEAWARRAASSDVRIRVRGTVGEVVRVADGGVDDDAARLRSIDG